MRAGLAAARVAAGRPGAAATQMASAGRWRSRLAATASVALRARHRPSSRCTAGAAARRGREQQHFVGAGAQQLRGARGASAPQQSRQRRRGACGASRRREREATRVFMRVASVASTGSASSACAAAHRCAQPRNWTAAWAAHAGGARPAPRCRRSAAAARAVRAGCAWLRCAPRRIAAMLDGVELVQQPQAQAFQRAGELHFLHDGARPRSCVASSSRSVASSTSSGRSTVDHLVLAAAAGGLAAGGIHRRRAEADAVRSLLRQQQVGGAEEGGDEARGGAGIQVMRVARLRAGGRGSSRRCGRPARRLLPGRA